MTTLDARKGFAVRISDALRRLDVNYLALSHQVERLLARPLFPLVSLGAIETRMQYGCSKLATAEPIGVPILRMNNLQPDGLDLMDLKYVQLSQGELETYRLEAGDILFNRTNSKELVGKCEVFRETGDWVFASYLIRLRVDQTRAIPEFVREFLSTQSGRAQIDRESRQIAGMTNINAEELRTLRIPLPDVPRQLELLAPLAAAREARRRRIREAEALLWSLDAYVLSRLQVSLVHPASETCSVYAVTRRLLTDGGRLNADYYHPERLLAIRALREAPVKSARLGDIVEFVRDTVAVQADTPCLGLAQVRPDTGERVEAPTGDILATGFRFRAGDVLFARLRPYLNKVYRAEEDGICSPEFHVIRVFGANNQTLDPDYLATVLRSSLVLNQTRHMMTGNTHPRLTAEDVANLMVPVADHHVQAEIASETVRRRIESRRLRAAAERDAEDARRVFEASLAATTGGENA